MTLITISCVNWFDTSHEKTIARMRYMHGLTISIMLAVKQALASFFLLANAQSLSAFTPHSFGILKNVLKTNPQSGVRNHQRHKESQRLMCGLVAAIDDIWNNKGGGVEEFDSISLLNGYEDEANEVLEKTTSILYHRGPDGMTCSSGSIGNLSGGIARWAMGHTRLAIVDPNNRNADMPFELDFEVDGKTKKVKLAVNGEIYNHEKLYSDLVEKDGWDHERISGSDCEVIAHSFAKHGGAATAAKLDGMFAFVVFEESVEDGVITVKAFAARDPVGIKPLYYGRSLNALSNKNDASGYVFSSELKALVGHVVPESVTAIPAGHYWTPEEGLVCYYNPDWLRKDDYAPWEKEEENTHQHTDDEIREAFKDAVKKRMMADVDYGFFLSGGIDSAVVSNVLLPLYKEAKEAEGDFTPIPTFTVGMENSPDVMAAKAVVQELGGEKCIKHTIRLFTPDEIFDKIPLIIYHMETYEAELIRSSIPNWFLAEAASKEVKMVLTGEGADELFAGYLYFQDAETPTQLQNELRRIYGMLGNINLHRTDRMTMAHSLEARVPFLDTEFTKIIMSVDPKKKMVDAQAVKSNSRGREKTMLRELYEKPNCDGDSIPRPVLWRAKAMQCEGVGEDWVAILQRQVSSLVTDDEMEKAAHKFPNNTPQTKEEYYYRRIFEEHFPNMDHVVIPWEGGGRAMGAEWKSDMYTREGLKNVDLLSHALQKDKKVALSATSDVHKISSRSSRKPLFSRLGFAANVVKRSTNTAIFSSTADTIVQSISEQYCNDTRAKASQFGYTEFESELTTGGDDRSLILESGANKYHIKPRPIKDADIFRGSCTGNPPTRRGYDAAKTLFDDKFKGLNVEQLDSAVRDVFVDQKKRLSEYLNLPKGTEILFCPSGSDAEYIPIAIAKSLHPTKKIANGVTQFNEIGAGTAPASKGAYFSSHAPFLGATTETYLKGFEGIESFVVPARAQNGEIINASKTMSEFCAQQLERGSFPIIHGVFGGKTGIRDETMPGSLGAGDISIGVVDACQGRFSLEELNGWLEQHSLVLFTTSKFYQAPPFCGAVIIPPSIASKVSAMPPPLDMLTGQTGLAAFLTDKELPSCLDDWRSSLKNERNNNVGLALRWEAGLASMKAVSHIPDDARLELSDEWANAVKILIDGSEMIDTFCVEGSIVSIRVAKDGGGWLGMDEARDLYRWMSLDVSGVVREATDDENAALSTLAFIGQPVSVSESFAIVRIALGAESLRSYHINKMDTLKEDRVIVSKLAVIAKYFHSLECSEL